MDDDKDKTPFEKLVDKLNDVVKNITTTVPDAVQHESDPVKADEQSVAYMPMAHLW